jgi:hypothetical protein
LTFGRVGSAGAVVSSTLTANPSVSVLPALSVLVQLIAVFPSGNVDPEVGVQVTGTLPSTRSVAVAA